MSQPEKKPDPIDIHVGRRLRLRRDLLKISQEKLANAAGVTFQQIQKYEQGKNRVSASRLFNIAHALGVAVSYFYEDIENNPSVAVSPSDPLGVSGAGEPAPAPLNKPFDDPMMRTETLELAQAYWKISSSEARARLLDLAKSMSGVS